MHGKLRICSTSSFRCKWDGIGSDIGYHGVNDSESGGELMVGCLCTGKNSYGACGGGG